MRQAAAAGKGNRSLFAHSNEPGVQVSPWSCMKQMLLLTRPQPLSQVVNSLYRHHGFPSFENQYQITPLFTGNYGRHPASWASLFSKSAIGCDLQVHFWLSKWVESQEAPAFGIFEWKPHGKVAGGIFHDRSIMAAPLGFVPALFPKAINRIPMSLMTYWLDRLALAWKGLELLACCSLTTWPPQGDLLSFQIVSQNDRNLPAYLTTLGWLTSDIMLLGFSIDLML